MFTAEEHAALQAVQQEDGFLKYCERSTKAQFNIYNKRYPIFVESGPESERFIAWKYHIVADGYNQESHCITYLPFKSAIDTNFESNLAYCGVFSRIPETHQEIAFAKAVKELVSYAGLAKLSVMYQLLILHNPGSYLSLNPDVEFFLRKSLQRNEEFNGVWYTGHLEPLMTPDRIEFVNAAVERGDLDAVLSSTSPCPVQPQ